MMENASTALKSQTQSALSETNTYAESPVSQIKGWFRTSRNYVDENPKEAAVIAVTLTIGAWALLSTRPGRRLFDVAADRFIPEIGQWLSKNFNSLKH